ncbi:hypothetical protein ACWC10_29965 [Streptomyces sp. NPDC001595]|uniref:hypothetical protein n=1 Tax=Streptomyces sp. NPDC001532 TaxID=3154520 RepID=UPI00331FE9EB
MQQGPHSTLVSCLNKLTWLLTGNFAKPGAMQPHLWIAPLARYSTSPRRTPVTGARMPGGLVPCNVITGGLELTGRGDPLGAGLLRTLARTRARAGALDDELRLEAADDLTDMHDPRGADLLHALARAPGPGLFTRTTSHRASSLVSSASASPGLRWGRTR